MWLVRAVGFGRVMKVMIAQINQTRNNNNVVFVEEGQSRLDARGMKPRHHIELGCPHRLPRQYAYFTP